MLTKKSNGFTLLEVLIATSLFVIVLVITIGTVGFGAGFQGRIALQRRVSDETRRVSDLNTRDVRAVNGTFKFVEGNKTYTFTGWLAEFYCIENCSLKNQLVPSKELTGVNSLEAANALIVSTKDSYKIYLSEGNKNKTPGIYYKEIVKDNTAETTFNSIDVIAIRKPENLITRENFESSVKFGGLAQATEATNKQQSFIQYLLLSRSKDYDTAKVQEKAKSEFRTTVTSISYK